MARFFVRNGKILIALGCGVVIGGSAVLLYKVMSRDLTRDVAQLADRLERLNTQLQELKETVRTLTPSATPSATPEPTLQLLDSSGSDDEFVEALEDDDAFRKEDERLQTVRTEDTGYNLLNSSVVEKEPQSFAGIDQLLDGSDDDTIQAYSVLQLKFKQNRENANVLWRLAKATKHMAEIEGARGDAQEQRALAYKAIDFAETALKLAPNDPSVHKWYAITVGSVGDYEPTQVKIKNGYVFREHIQKAIDLKPQDPSAHYLLGRWCYGVYMLSWLERKAAAALYAAPPSSTVDEALESFMKAEELKSGVWKDNMLYIAKCFIEKRNYYESVVWLQKASKLDIVNQDDRSAQKEIDTLLLKYSNYKS